MFDITGAKIAVIGLNPDGFSLAKLAASRGFETVAFDPDEVKIAQLEAADGKRSRNLSITSDESQLRNIGVFVICPISGKGEADLEELEAAAATAGKRVGEDVLIIVESIVFPGVCEHVILPMLEKSSGLVRPSPERPGAGFFFAHAPLARGGSSRVIGASDGESLLRARAFYRALGRNAIPMRSIKEAETVRMLESALHDVALALSGEFSILFDRIGIDIANVWKAVETGSADLASLSGIGMPHMSESAYYLARSGHEHQIDQQLLSAARRIIEYMPSYAVNILSDALRDKKVSLKDAVIALLGISDANGSIEGSVGSRIRVSLAKKGAIARAYDPYVAGAGTNLKATLEGAQAAVIAIDHPMFRNLTARQFEELGILVVLDARNCLDRDVFEKSPVTYRGIGRG